VRVPDFEGQRRREFDFIITTPSEVILVELKNWSGRLEVHGDDFVQFRRNGEELNHGPILHDLANKEDTFAGLLESRGCDVPPVRSILLFYKKRLDFRAANTQGNTTILTANELFEQLPDARKTILEMLWEFLEKLLGTSSNRSNNGSKATSAILQTRGVLDSLGTWDILQLHGGQQLAGDILWVQDRDADLSDRDEVSKISVSVSRNYFTAIFGSLAGYRDNCSLEVKPRSGQPWEKEVSLDADVYFHAAGSEKPENFPVRRIEQISYGYTEAATYLLGWDDISEGDVYTGRVRNVAEFGVFVDFGGPTDALLHISEIDKGNYTQADELEGRFPAGSEIRVRVLDVDRSRERISLAIA
jgi:hypothetical protein